MKAAITQQTGISLASDPEKVPLTFFHKSRYFTHSTYQAIFTVTNKLTVRHS